MPFNDDQPRDERGRWGSGGFGGSSSSSSARSADRANSSDRANKSSSEARKNGSPETHKAAAKAHTEAAKAHKSVFKDTEEAFKKDGEWKPQRKEIHESYTNHATKDVPTSDTPTVHMTGGGPASGKSTGLLSNPQTKIPGHKNAAHIDPDGAKLHIPEYKDMVAAGDKSAAAFVHEESSHMAKQSVNDALSKGHDVVYDSVGDSGIAKLSGKVEQMRKQGAKRIVAHYATVDVDEAIKRSDARAAKTGRFVPHEYIRNAHKDVARTSVAAIETGLFDALDVYDTSGRDPVHVASYTKEKGLKVHDQAAWDRHKARGAD